MSRRLSNDSLSIGVVHYRGYPGSKEKPVGAIEDYLIENVTQNFLEIVPGSFRSRDGGATVSATFYSPAEQVYFLYNARVGNRKRHEHLLVSVPPCAVNAQTLLETAREAMREDLFKKGLI